MARQATNNIQGPGAAAHATPAASTAPNAPAAAAALACYYWPVFSLA